MLFTKIVFCFEIQNNLCAQHVLPMFSQCSLYVLSLEFSFNEQYVALHIVGQLMQRSAAAAAIGQSRFGISRHLKQNLCHSFRHTGHTVRFSQICFTIKYFVCLFELGLYYFKAVFKLRTYTPHIHKLYFSILLCLDLNILLCLDFSILLCLDFSILLCLDFSILLCLDFSILLCLDFKMLLCLDGIHIAT